MKVKFSVITILFLNILFSQEKLDSIVPIKISFLDSIKKTFVHDETAACVDASIISELTNKELFNELVLDLENFDFETPVDYELSTELLKERLAILDSKTDFDIAYNPGLENVIKYYLKNRKKSTERLMGLSEYYFPLYESTLAKHNVPLEIKYLSIVESALNPKAVSRVGATGLWQFMYGTGKEYGLEIDTYIDERSDPIKSSEAACEYMKRMYKIFGDWDLVLASYNAGPGNVSKAIRRSGGKQNYWNIRPFLPKETQGYVPAFLATMYMFEFHKEHGLKPQKPVANLYATDTIHIKNKISFKQISELLDISVEHLRFFNPIYKRDMIPYIKNKISYLRLPLDKVAVFTSNEDKMYTYANYDFNKKEKYNYKEKDVIVKNDGENTFKIIEKVKYHKVKKGETLGEIASKYDVRLSEIKKWNGLRKNIAKKGAKLKIIKEERIAIQPKISKDSLNTKPNHSIVATKTNVETPKIIEPIDNNSNINIENSIVDLKDKNQTQIIEKAEKNNLISTNNKTINTQNNQDFIIHIVKKGQGLIAIAKEYNTDIDTIKKYNKIKKKGIFKGQKLKILKNENTSEIATNENNSNNYHLVKDDETLYTISKKYNISIKKLKKINNLDSDIINGGTNLIVKEIAKDEVKIVKKEIKKPKDEIYKVKSGDTLIKISKKYENVTVADLKKWNNLKNGDIRPGMKLIIKA